MADSDSSANAPAGTLPTFSDDDLKRVADEHEVLPVTVLRSLCDLPLKGRSVRERARRAASKLRGG